MAAKPLRGRLPSFATRARVIKSMVIPTSLASLTAATAMLPIVRSAMPDAPTLDELLTEAFGDSVPESGRFAKINERRVVHSSGFDVFLRIFHADGGELTYRDRDRTVRCEAGIWNRQGTMAASICWNDAEELSRSGETPTQLTTTEIGRIQAALAVLDLETEPHPRLR